MKLFIKRNQAKGILGAVNFELAARVELEEDEAELVRKYNAGKEVLLQKEIRIPFTNTSVMLDIRIDGLIGGQSFKCKDIADILEYEKNIKEACETFRNYIEVMKQFGGEEVVAYRASSNRPDDKVAEIAAARVSVDPFIIPGQGPQSPGATPGGQQPVHIDCPFCGSKLELDDREVETMLAHCRQCGNDIPLEDDETEGGSGDKLMFCYHCGEPLDGEQAKCPHCGKKL